PSDYLVGVFATHGIAAQAIGNFVDEDQVVFRERSRLAPRFLSNRNFEAHYNVAAVLRAFAIIQRAHPDARLVVAGDGPQRSELHALAKRLELRNVDFVGPVQPGGMAALYDSADIYLNSPSIDNMPNSVIEAFAAGLPVVSTDAGGIPFIVRHEENGLLVSVDDHEGLAREALRLLDDEALSASIARAARSECLSQIGR